MPEPVKQEKYGDLKRATRNAGITAICVFAIDTFLLGAPAFSSLFAIYVVLYLLPVTLFSILNRPKLKFFGYKLLIYAVMVIASIGLHEFEITNAEHRAEPIIAAVNKYQQDKGHYPDGLANLVPAYLAEIPEARIIPAAFAPTGYSYFGAPDDPHLMFVDFPPFGRMSWSFQQKEWITID